MQVSNCRLHKDGVGKRASMRCSGETDYNLNNQDQKQTHWINCFHRLAEFLRSTTLGCLLDQSLDSCFVLLPSVVVVVVAAVVVVLPGENCCPDPCRLSQNGLRMSHFAADPTPFTHVRDRPKLPGTCFGDRINQTQPSLLLMFDTSR